jgi:hypothetical protein
MSKMIRGLALILTLTTLIVATPSTVSAAAARPRPIRADDARASVPRWMAELVARLRWGIFAGYAPELAARARIAGRRAGS